MFTLSPKLEANSKVGTELMVKSPENTLLEARSSSKVSFTSPSVELMVSAWSLEAMLSTCACKSAITSLMLDNPSASEAEMESPRVLWMDCTVD